MDSIMKEFEHLVIKLEDIKSATNNFDEKKVIGGGGFGKVYKGEVSHNKGRSMVAFKRLDRKFGQGGPEFWKEIMMLSRYTHENLISLLGYCNEGGEMILVYELASNGSLDRHLSSTTLTWTQRIKICLDVARGISYLHDDKGTQQRVLHRDIKSSNILLDEKWNAKVSDLGLAKIGPANQQHTALFTTPVGTLGYLDPLYLQIGILTKESDVYSFGVVLFEVLCGRLCYEKCNGGFMNLVGTWKKRCKLNKIDELILKDSTLKNMDPTSLVTFTDIALRCLNKSREERPLMADVVEKLEIALKSQEYVDLIPIPKEHEEIVKAVVPPLIYKSIEELKVLLSKGVILNGGKTWLCINEKGEHIERIYIEACLNPDKIKDYSLQHPFDEIVNSRFPGGLCYKYGYWFKNDGYWFNGLKARVRGQYLTPHISYTLNLIFRYEYQSKVNSYNPLRYKIDGEDETKVFIIYPCTHMIQDGWLAVPLYHFTSERNTAYLQFEFQYRRPGLLVAGFEFHPSEEKVQLPVFEEYQHIVEAASQSLVYTSLDELKQILTQGVHLNRYKTWFSINEKGQHCHMISMKDCLIPNEDSTPQYESNWKSRFPTGFYQTKYKGFKTLVKTQFLSPSITYTVNLVYDSYKEVYVNLKYRLSGEATTSVVFLENYQRREDELYMAELYQFTSDGSIVDLEITFDNHGSNLHVEGILFQPKSQEPVDLIPKMYQEIGNAVVHRVILNGGETWLFINEKGEHVERIYIGACLNPDEIKDYSLQHPSDKFVNSSFPGRLCYIYGSNGLKARVRGEYLTPHISYTLNLIFRYKYQSDVNKYNPLRYKIDGEDDTKVFIIYPCTHMREDGWFIVPLYHFTTQHKAADLQFQFESRYAYLLVAGIEFQPCEEKVQLPVFEEYQHIVEAASQSLVYTSLADLKQILSKGVHLNRYKEWFSINEKGEHCHMISMEDCLIPNEDSSPQYVSLYYSRFPASCYRTKNKGFKTHVKTQLLSPSITYTVNLLYYGLLYGEQVYLDLKYRLRGEATTSAVCVANQIDENLLYMAELYQLTSDGSIVDLEITFDNHASELFVEGILFQPLEIVEGHPESDPEFDPAQKLQDDYEEVLKLSKDSLMWTSKKELYSILRSGFLINNGQQWFTVDYHGKKCPMLSARATCVIDDKNSACKSSHESRFGEVLVITARDKFKLVNKIKPEVLSADTLYASYFVYKLPQDRSTFENPLKVNTKNQDVWFVYLVSPPGTPVIGPKFDENRYNPLNRHKQSALPRQRSDGWMEVKVWQFKTWSTPETVSMHLKLKHPVKKDLSGLIIHGIELRPI